MRKLDNSELGRVSVEEYKILPKHPIVLVLDNIRSLHNVGSAFRTADAFKLEKIYLCGITGQPPQREIRKTALGASESVDWVYCEDTLEAVQKLKEDGYQICSVEQVEGSTSLEAFEVNSAMKYALVFGNEVFGVEEKVIKSSDCCIEIPQFGTKHSINVSVSMGVLCWHMIAQLIK